MQHSIIEKPKDSINTPTSVASLFIVASFHGLGKVYAKRGRNVTNLEFGIRNSEFGIMVGSLRFLRLIKLRDA